MPTYLATFGTGHPNGQGYVKVTAPDYNSAYVAMSLRYNRKWCALYPWSEAERMIQEYGYYCVAELNIAERTAKVFDERQPNWPGLYSPDDLTDSDRERMGL